MALVLADRVKETTTTTGTGTYTLAGAVTGFESFGSIGNTNTTYYCCTDGTDFEVGIGTYASSGTTLARTTILQSSNSDNAVNWTSGTRTIFCTIPAEKLVFEDASGNISIPGTIDGRDLATDGTKLDGIEASADVTDATNVTAAGALMDSEVTNLAQVKAFDSSDYATAAQGTTADNALPKAGGTMTGNLSLSGTNTRINMPDNHVINRRFELDAVDASGVGYVLLCRNAASNDVNGRITMDRTSGLRHACQVDIIVSSGNSSNPIGSLKAHGVTVGSGSSPNGPSYELVTVTYDSDSNSYVALKITNPDQYYETSGAFFTGRLVNSGSNTLLAVPPSGISSEAQLSDANAKHTFQGDLDILDNIVIAGTVDGRDIATDGTKLDGIESNATADQTAAEIRTLVESASDSNVFTDADHTKLNAIASSATANPNAIDNVVEDTTPQLGGDLDLNSSDITGTGNINITGTLQTSSNAIIGGDLTVSGTTTTVNTETINLADNNILLNSNLSSSTAPSENGGITINRGNATDKVFQWNESTDYWEVDAIFEIDTDSGYVQIGSRNSTYTHFYTDRDKYYFNKELVVDEGIINSYDEDLKLGRAFSSTARMRLTDGTTYSDQAFDVTGNITVSGTVDGRDVATDGTKLDGIEASATADQTAAEIRTLVESASDSNVFTDADHTKLNGIEASADVTDATNVAAAGALMTTGGTITGNVDLNANLSFDDSTGSGNNRIRMGTGNDLHIFHNGSNAKITNNTGTLQIGNNNDDGDVTISTDDGSGGNANYFRADGSTGDAILYHYGSEKIKTQSGGVDVTGNITVSGTVDGRDVAADGTKLDGIEASADVTDATNVTAAGALMDSEVTNLAQVKAFDSSDYATAAQGTTADAALPKAGGTMTGALNLNDSTNINIGAGNDLQLYHDGSVSYIDNNTSHLYIRNNVDGDDGGNIYLQAKSGENGIIINDDGAVQLYYNGSQKVQVHSTYTYFYNHIYANSYDLYINDVFFSGSIDGSDNDQIKLGTSDDFLLYHDGTDNIIEPENGQLVVAKTGTGSTELQIGGKASSGGSATLTLTPVNGYGSAVVNAAGSSSSLTLQQNGTAKATVSSSALTLNTGVDLIFEGATADANETTVTVADPTADRTITLPDATGTVMLNTNLNFPFFQADGSSDTIALTADLLLPFTEADGSTNNIALTT